MSEIDEHQVDELPAYRKLDINRKEIRLLKLYSGSKEDPICCTLASAYLAEQSVQDYETISYVLGDERLRGCIVLNGSLLDVALSSENVLKRVRHTHSDRMIWIDSVCINQADDLERASQVAMMYEIYGRTVQNLIWLGEDPEGLNDRALASISALIEDIKDETDNFRLYTRFLYDTYGQFLFSQSPISRQIDWPAYEDYMDSVWFTRLWVVQEAVLSPRSICLRGTSERPLDDVLRAACWVIYKSQSAGKHPKLIKGVSSAVSMAMHADSEFGKHSILYNRGVQAIYLSSLATGMSQFDARDERDYVYGMLGLYRKYFGNSLHILPDYTTTYDLVFRDVTRQVIVEEETLRILYGIYRRPELGHLPSWVYPFHVRYDSEVDQRESREQNFAAADNIQLNVTKIAAPVNANVLSLEGFRIIQILRTSDEISRRLFDRGRHNAVREFLDTANTMVRENTQISGLERQRMTAHTLCKGLDGYAKPIESDQSLDLYNAFVTFLDEKDDLPSQLTDLTPNTCTESRKASIYWQALLNACLIQRIFITSLGHFGVAPLSAQVGDWVVILFGAKYPYLLRPVKGKSGQYELVGYCYVYGIMMGEAVSAWRQSEQGVETFDLV